MSVAANSNIWIATASEETTWPALFMPRGSTLVLLYDEAQIPKGQSNHPAMQDFDVWNHMPHLKVHWLSVQHESTTLLQLLVTLIQDQLPKSYAISDSVGGRTFNGRDIQLVSRSPLPSSVHCVGENWEWDADNHRSCEIENLCFDISRREFVMVPEIPPQGLRSSDIMSTSFNEKHVMMGQSIRLGTGEPWFPNASTATPESYYSLGSNVVWLPYFAEQPNANNPGHLLWDYWFPLYTLVEMFGYGDETALFMTNLDRWCVSYAPYPCYNVTTKFLPLLGVDPSTFFNSYNPQLRLDEEPKSNFVCASRGLAGIGMLTDHGFKKHGQLIDDYKNVHNTGRGVAFWRFRTFMLRNIGVMKESTVRAPYKITFSINSSNNPSRRCDFEKQIELIKVNFPYSVVRTVNLGKLSLKEQISIVKESSIFISAVGGSASTAMFMERNTCLILYFNDKDDFVKGAPNEKMPNMMDWDFWNNASYLRVHWLPIQSMDSERDLRILDRLVENEIESFPFMM
jgi:hypothetical protein